MTIDLDARALFNADGTHRYYLSRQFGGVGPAMTYVMLNPSTADADDNDKTIETCCRIAKHNGASSIRVVNLYSRISTNPRDLYHMTEAERITPEARAARDFVLGASDRIVFAWGGSYKRLLPSIDDLQNLVDGCKKPPMCIGRCKNGAPKHPLYQRADVELREYSVGVSGYGR